MKTAAALSPSCSKTRGGVGFLNCITVVSVHASDGLEPNAPVRPTLLQGGSYSYGEYMALIGRQTR